MVEPKPAPTGVDAPIREITAAESDRTGNRVTVAWKRVVAGVDLAATDRRTRPGCDVGRGRRGGGGRHGGRRGRGRCRRGRRRAHQRRRRTPRAALLRRGRRTRHHQEQGDQRSGAHGSNMASTWDTTATMHRGRSIWRRVGHGRSSWTTQVRHRCSSVATSKCLSSRRPCRRGRPRRSDGIPRYSCTVNGGEQGSSQAADRGVAPSVRPWTDRPWWIWAALGSLVIVVLSVPQLLRTGAQTWEHYRVRYWTVGDQLNSGMILDQTQYLRITEAASGTAWEGAVVAPFSRRAFRAGARLFHGPRPGDGHLGGQRDPARCRHGGPGGPRGDLHQATERRRGGCRCLVRLVPGRLVRGQGPGRSCSGRAGAGGALGGDAPAPSAGLLPRSSPPSGPRRPQPWCWCPCWRRNSCDATSPRHGAGLGAQHGLRLRRQRSPPPASSSGERTSPSHRGSRPRSTRFDGCWCSTCHAEVASASTSSQRHPRCSPRRSGCPDGHVAAARTAMPCCRCCWDAPLPWPSAHGRW